jgi:hypothetical protein
VEAHRHIADAVPTDCWAGLIGEAADVFVFRWSVPYKVAGVAPCPSKMSSSELKYGQRAVV